MNTPDLPVPTLLTPPSLAQVRDQWLYTDWANDRLCQMLYAAFGEETDLRSPHDPRICAIQVAAVHIIAAQAIWRERWEGHSPKEMLDPAEYPTPLAIRMAFGAERARFWGWFATLQSDSDLERMVHATSTHGEPRIFPLWQILNHVVTHGCYHRGQITGRLLDMGHDQSLLTTDLIAYYKEG